MLNYHPEDKKVVVLKIPAETYMDLPKGFGSWRVGSIYDLGQEENPPVGSELLKESLSKLLGLPIDGFITLNKKSANDDIPKLILSWRNNPIEMLKFVRDINTDLTPIETYNLLSKLSGVRADKIVSLDLEETNITKSKLLGDSSRVLGIDYVNLDSFIRDNMADESLSQEQISIAIFNATSHPGLAQEAARILTNLGVDPIIVTNSENLIDKTIVTSSSDSLAKNRFSQIFAPSCLKIKCLSSDPKIASSRADINIVLGEDFYKLHTQR